MSKHKWKVGDQVTMDKWDAYEQPWNQLRDCTITHLAKAKCESGIMATVRNAKGSEQELDIAWLEPRT